MCVWIWKEDVARTLFLINLAGVVEKADEVVLPGVYREVGLTMHASPSSLGSLTLLRSLMQLLCSPLAACLVLRYDRPTVIALGALMWAIPTFCVGISTSFFQVAVARALTGIGLAVVRPAVNALIADATDNSTRGVAYGWMHLTSNVGATLGGIIPVVIAGNTLFEIPGWRISFFLIAFASVMMAFALHQFAVDPRATGHQKHNESPRKFISHLKELAADAKRVVKIKSFQVIIAQGVLGSFPWRALTFQTMWLELIGYSHAETALLIGIFTAAGSIGVLFGGKLGDILSIHLPNTGRIILSQISAGSGPPIAAILLLALPYTPQLLLRGFIMFTFGFLTSWNVSATNSPILAEIVPEQSRTLVFALDSCFEPVFASFAPPAVGFLAERMFGYSVNSDNRRDVSALGRAIFTCYAIPLTLCSLVYSLLYCTYPHDRDKAQADAGLLSSRSYMKLGVLRTAASGDFTSLDFNEIVSPYKKDKMMEMEVMLPAIEEIDAMEK